MEVTVVIACHFKSKNELCETTIARLKTALQSAQKGDLVWVTGDVPFAPGGPTLGNLMKDWLAERNTESSILLGGVGTFSEARKACESASQKGLNIKIVSSLWHLFQAKPIWQRRAEENGVKISFIPVGHTGGWRTIAIYYMSHSAL